MPVNQNPEQITSDHIDDLLRQAGWKVQSVKKIYLNDGLGQEVREYRTNIHHTLKKKPLRFDDLKDFITCYNPLNRHERKESWDAASNPEGRWRKFTREQVVARDKTSLDIFWLKDKSLADLDNLPEPDDLAAEIVENVEAGLNSFCEIVGVLA